MGPQCREAVSVGQEKPAFGRQGAAQKNVKGERIPTQKGSGCQRELLPGTPVTVTDLSGKKNWEQSKEKPGDRKGKTGEDFTKAIKILGKVQRSPPERKTIAA